MIRFAAFTAVKDLLVAYRDPVGFFIWLGVPLGIMTTVFLAFGRFDLQPRPHLLVADQQQSFLSRSLIGLLGEAPVRQWVDVELVDEARGRERLDQGDATALVVIPMGFDRALLEEQPLQIPVVVDPSKQILPRVVVEALEAGLESVFYAQRLLGDPMRAGVDIVGELETTAAGLPAQPLTDAEAARLGVEINRVFRRGRGIASALQVPVESRTVGEPWPSEIDTAWLFFPSMILVALLLSASGLSGDLWRERTQRTLQRALACPIDTRALLLGKLAGGVAIQLLVTAILLAIAVQVMGVEVLSPAGALAWSALVGGVFYLGFGYLQTFASAQDSAFQVTNLVTLPLLMLGGGFIPFELMPDWLAAVGQWTPNGFALESLKGIVRGTSGAGEALLGSIPLLLLGALLFRASVGRLDHGFAREATR